MDLVRTINKIKQLPPELHWFCARSGSDQGRLCFPEDIRGDPRLQNDKERKKIEQEAADARSRNDLILEGLQIFAYDGEDAKPYQDWFEKQLHDQMASCDICIREYHRARWDLKQKLEENYEADDVATFMRRFDALNSKRIRRGLQEAKQILEGASEKERGLKALQSASQQSLYALFECLQSDPLLRDEPFLVEYFDKPFQLVQQNRKLKLTQTPPAIGYFIFQSQSDSRRMWAEWSLAKRKGNLTANDFRWSIQAPLSIAMQRVLLADLDRPFLYTFWKAVRFIVSKLDADLITHSLRAMECDICRLALDHLQIDDADAFKELSATMQRIIELSPSDFWSGMSHTTAEVWITQFFHSRAFARWMGRINDSETGRPLLDELLGWVVPFVASVRPVHQASICQNLADILFDKLQTDEFDTLIKEYCQELGFRVIATSINAMSLEKLTPDVRTAAATLLKLVQSLTTKMIDFSRKAHSLTKPCAELLNQTLALEIECMEDDRRYLSQDRVPPNNGCIVHTELWQSCCKTLTTDNMLMAEFLLTGCKGLVGMEKYHIAKETSMTPRLEQFNEKFDTMNSYVADMLERMNDFDAGTLQLLFEEEDVLNAFVMQLLSSDGSVRSAAVDVVKTISGQTVRYEAIADALTQYFEGVMNAFSIALRRIGSKAAYAPASTMLATCKDVLDILCSSSKGLLRVTTMSQRGIDATENFWVAMWEELFTIFTNTEPWSNVGRETKTMMGFCGDVMEFAGIVFEQFPVFVGALSAGGDIIAENRPAGQRLTEQPKAALPAMIKFLRLRDAFLLTKSTDLICNVLRRLKQYDSVIETDTIAMIENVILGRTRTMLSTTQKAELHRALEDNLGKPVGVQERSNKADTLVKKMQTGKIDMSKWQSEAGKQSPLTHQSVLDSASAGSIAYRQRQAAQSQQATTQRSKAPPTISTGKPDKKSDAEATAFARKRQEEIAAKKQRDKEAVARARAKMGGSGLSGIGVAGKDHTAPKGEGVMVSSDESEDDQSEDEMDKELFGGSTKAKSATGDKKKDGDKTKKLPPQQQGPVKKQRLVRSAKDMRARLAPDLAPLHKQILGWNANHVGPFPPNTTERDYLSISSAFRDPSEYQNTFQPLLLLEAWNGFLKAKEENQSRPVEMKVITRSSVDAFSEVSASIDSKEFKDFSEGDIVLIAKDVPGLNDDRSPKCLARVMKILRKKTHMEFLYRVLPNGPISQALNPQSTLQFLKIMPIVPLEREYGALLGLQYYDLCEEIASAKPSPLLPYRDETLAPYQKNYGVNKAQAKAIKSAIDNDAFTLVQGPPGSGKTKTIVAIIDALLTSSMQGKSVPVSQPNGGAPHPQARSSTRKMLVCAPSNAAVDELVMRFKDGVRLTNGSDRPLNVVRLGRSDAINANVRDVTLEELVDKRLNIVSEGQAREETTKIMREHQQISQKLREARDRLNSDDTAETRKDVDDLRKSKSMLSQKVDMAKDNEGQASRQAEMNRRKAQQEVIEEAHVICATLSGSGHDMFQNLNVEFETVVIDEAAQCVELSALIPLKYGCAKCILVGDPQQLPPTIFSKEATNYKYEQSLFVRMQSNHPQAVHLLDTQYRMHPEISKFPSSAFYDSRLKDGPDMAQLRTRPWHEAELTGPFRFFDVAGSHSAAPTGHSLVNRAEIAVAMELYRRITSDFKVDFQRKVGVITPYKAQLRELKSRFSREFGGHITQDIEFNTTDAFQGRESEIIIFSCVRASPAGGVGFLSDIRRMNVGLTRAKSSLWVLGNSQSLLKGRYWKQLIEYAQKSNRFTSGDIQKLLRKPLKKTQKVNAPSEGEKMPQLDYGDDSDGPTPPSKKNSDAMDVDDQRQPSRMQRPGSQKKDSARRPSDLMDIDGEDRKSRPAEASVKKDYKPKPSPSGSASDVSTAKKRKASDTPNTLEKNSKASKGDVEMTDASSSRASEKHDKPKKPSTAEAPKANGDKPAPVRRRKQETSIFTPKDRR